MPPSAFVFVYILPSFRVSHPSEALALVSLAFSSDFIGIIFRRWFSYPFLPSFRFLIASAV